MYCAFRLTTIVKKRLAKEARIWSEVQHDNILPVLGYFIGTDEYLNVISEWMANGSLADYKEFVPRGEETLRMVCRCSVTDVRRWEIRFADVTVSAQIYGIGHGLLFLHSSGVVHSDLNTVSLTPLYRAGV